MNAVSKVCLLGLGEVGAVLAEDLLSQTRVGLHLWDPLFYVEDSVPSQRVGRISSGRVYKAKNALDAVAGTDLVISAVTADQAVAAAESVLLGLQPLSWFVDLNSVSPATKRRIDDNVNAAGGRFVEAAVMAPILSKRIATPIYLAGQDAGDFLPVAKGLGFAGMSCLSTKAGQAAASKMCRSVIVKGLEALVTEALLAARFYGVENQVLGSLENLFPHPDWPGQARYMLSRSLQHGGRRAEEMREVAKTVEEAGVTPWMSRSCAERQQWAGALPVQAAGDELAAMLDDIRNTFANTGTD